jgi:hypothetical protein
MLIDIRPGRRRLLMAVKHQPGQPRTESFDAVSSDPWSRAPGLVRERCARTRRARPGGRASTGIAAGRGLIAGPNQPPNRQVHGIPRTTTADCVHSARRSGSGETGGFPVDSHRFVNTLPGLAAPQ